LKAGLFSAVITAFTVEYAEVLKSDRGNDDKIVLLLQHISNQLSDPTLPGANVIFDSRQFTGRDVRIGTMWILSIVLNLSAALIGILAKQWIREFQREISEVSSWALQRRQLRYEALLQWKVPEIISALPVLIELGVMLFFIGMIDFLWGTDTVVFAISTLVIIVVLLCVIISTILPAVFYPTSAPVDATAYKSIFASILPCAYRSPQAHALRALVGHIFSQFYRVKGYSGGNFWWPHTLYKWENIETYLLEWVALGHYRRKSMQWVREHLVNNPVMVNHFVKEVQRVQDNGHTNGVYDSLVCARHAGQRCHPSFVWKSSELDMLDPSTAMELCINSQNLWFCEKCTRQEPEYRELLHYLRFINSNDLSGTMPLFSFCASLKVGLTFGLSSRCADVSCHQVTIDLWLPKP
jgi:hypothetical protein